MPAELEVTVEGGVPTEVPVGRGGCAMLRGSCSSPGHRIRSVRLLIDGRERAQTVLTAREHEPSGGARWWAITDLAATDHRVDVTLELEARIGLRGRVRARLGTIALEPGWEPPRLDFDAAAERGDGSITGALELRPLVAVCLATDRPDLDDFRRSIEALTGQTYENWHCVVRDADPHGTHLGEMRQVVGDSKRFALDTGGNGIYGGFEQAMMNAPARAPYLVLTSPGDPWDARTLEVLLSELGPDSNAVIPVTTTGVGVGTRLGVRRRTPSREAIASVALGRTTVTGPLLFRRELLDYVLPLPPTWSQDSRPNQWLALVARAVGGVTYVDAPPGPDIDRLSSPFHRRPDRSLGRIAPVVAATRVVQTRCGEFASPRDLRQLRRISSAGRLARLRLWRTGRASHAAPNPRPT